MNNISTLISNLKCIAPSLLVCSFHNLSLLSCCTYPIKCSPCSSLISYTESSLINRSASEIKSLSVQRQTGRPKVSWIGRATLWPEWTLVFSQVGDTCWKSSLFICSSCDMPICMGVSDTNHVTNSLHGGSVMDPSYPKKWRLGISSSWYGVKEYCSFRLAIISL